MTLWEVFRITLAVGLPWLAGALWALLFLQTVRRGRFAIALGCGFPLGMLATSGIILGLDGLGWSQGFWRTGVWLLAACSIPALLLYRSQKDLTHAFGVRLASPRGSESAFHLRLISTVLLALIGFRLATIFLEVIWRPLFPWDAWYAYGMAARVWFEHQVLVSIAGATEWWTSPEPVYTAGGIRHPPGIPLIQFWMVQGLGRWDDALMNLPWPFAAACSALLMFGLLRASGANTLLALGAAYLLVSLPVFATHAALGGYGDLWVGLYLLLASGGLFLSVKDRDWRPLVMIAFAVGGMVMMKQWGGIWIAAILAGVLFGWLRARWAALVCLGVLALGLMLVFLLEVEFHMRKLGSFVFGPDGLEYPGYQQVWSHFAEHLFLMANWHLLWYIVPVALVSATWLSIGDRAVRSVFTLVCVGLSMLLIVFFFTGGSDWVVTGRSVNRLLLQLVPSIIFLCGLVAHFFMQSAEKPFVAFENRNVAARSG